MKGIIGDDANHLIDNIKNFCDIGERFYDPFYTLSLGMKARVQFAIKTSLTSEIVLVDEVLGAGDTTMALKASKRIQEISQSSTFVCVSHSLSHIRAFTKRCIWIKDQSIYMDAHTDDVLSSYEVYMNKKIEENIQELRSNSLVQNTTYKHHETQPSTNDTISKFFDILSANDNISENGCVVYQKEKSHISFSESLHLILESIESDQVLSISYYHVDKPHRILILPADIPYKLNTFVLGDGKWLMTICKKMFDSTIEYHLYDVHVPCSNNSDPPLLILNPTIDLNSSNKLQPYLSSRC